MINKNWLAYNKMSKHLKQFSTIGVVAWHISRI